MGRAALLPDLTGSYRAQRAALARTAQRCLLDLHPRELEVLQLIARGDTSAEIAATLRIKRNTVRTHMLHISAKTQVYGVVRLARLAMRAGLTSLWAEQQHGSASHRTSDGARRPTR